MMMSRILTRFWQWLFPARLAVSLTRLTSGSHDAYDPAQDDEKIMRGEIESYFD
jgi:hypothetical protein